MLNLTIYARPGDHDALRKEFLAAVSRILGESVKITGEESYRLACEQIGARLIRHHYDHIHHHLTIGR